MELEEKPYAVYGVSGEALELLQEEEQLAEIIPGYEPYDFSEEDSCYVMLWNSQLEGIPIVSGNYPEGTFNFECRGGAESGCIEFAVVSRDGLELLLSDSNQFEIIGKEEEQPLLSLEEILMCIPDYYESTLITEKRTVSKMSFRYVPVLKGTEENADSWLQYSFDMVPAWCMETWYQKEESMTTYWEVIYINALTGEIIH